MSERAAIATDFTVPSGTEAGARPVQWTSAPVLTDFVRTCTPADLPKVAMLFQHVFRQHDGEPSRDLIAHLEDVYFRHPWCDADLPSLVLERSDGTLDGFIGIIPLRLQFRGRSILGSVAGAFMVRDPDQRPLAAARLMRTHVSGMQHVSFGDTTNGPARAMWEKLGGHMLPMASMEWLKIIRWIPFGASSAVSHLPAALRIPLRPIASFIEWAGWTLRGRSSPPPAQGHSETVDDGAYLAAAAQVSAKLELQLALDEATGRWLLGIAAQKRKHGALFRRVVFGRGGKPIGCYLVYCRRGQPAETLQVVSAPRDVQGVLGDLFAFAAGQGCTAVRGRAQGPLLDSLFRAGCLMRHRSATVFRTADEDLRTELESGRIALGGFFGETWTRLVSDEFGGQG